MRQSSGTDQITTAATPGPVLRAELPAEPRSAGQARSAARRAMAAWGMADLSADTELLASELVANAVEHANGQSIGFVLRRLADAEGQAAVTCEVSDSSPDLPEARDAGPDADRGRGLAIVTALAAASGVRTSQGGKTAWFTLPLSGCAKRVA
ncbi:MAG TPA: ATP-binding protein [Streptosporangiaceae bacterium]|nr:ATP-binding protein [Streptosporangiaceae bacterium]